MTDPGILGYLGVFLATVAFVLVLTPLALKYAINRDVLDRPGLEYKIQESPVPYLGGLAIVVAFSLVVLLASLVRPPETGLDELALILGLAVVLAVMGLVDDLRGLSPLLRLGVEIGAGIALVAAGTGVELTGNTVIDGAVTVIWIAGITNAFNLLDNMDGLSAGVAAIASAFFFLIAAQNGQFLVATLAAGVAGCSLGFLRSNFHPARIYMGDAGALFLGFLLAVIGIKLQFESSRFVTAFVPVLVLGVALFDTTLVAITRVTHRLNPFAGGRDHTSHRLVFVGLSVPVAVSLIYAGAVSLGWLAVVMSRLEDKSTGLVLMAYVLTAAAFVGVLLGRVPVHASSKRRHLMLQEVAPHEAHSEPSTGAAERHLGNSA